ncbi:MAG: electron transport complex subunit RsxC [Clostridia bacterium]|nr:electron transport complex subunit RsxC [Clostridia bacterium]
MPKWSFRGGTHPPENKSSTAGLPIVPAKLPSRIAVLIHANSGCLQAPIVAKGDQVQKGQLLANPGAKLAVPVHSPTSGKVVGIGPVRTASGALDQAIFIEPDGEDRLAETCAPVTNLESLSKEQIIGIIMDAGIVGMGGAEFPTHVKLTLPANAKVDTLLINGAECEPYLTADHRLMLERSGDIVRGAQILMKALGVTRTVIGVEDNKPDAIEAMTKAASKAPGVEVVSLRTRYPQGSEKQLIKSTLGRDVPPGCLPFHVGVVVNNAATAVSVADRFDRGLPLIERVVTITGSAIAHPANLLVKIGTSAGELIEQCGGFVGEPAKLIFGGPMMGMAVSSPDVPTSKGCSGILALSRAEARVYEPMPCIRCGRCIEACPMGLEPAVLHQWSDSGIWDQAEACHAMDCIECGVCSYECPSRRNLVQSIKRAKFEIGVRRQAAKERRAK